MALTLGSLFTGYGGLDMAPNDVELKWVPDIDPGPCKLIAERVPTVPNLGDITQVDWSSVEPVDIIAGGSPCTDISTAGQRVGMGPGTKSGLWESMFYAIQELRPSWVIWENVLGARSAKAYSDVGWTEGLLDERSHEQKPAKEDRPLRALGRVLGDLASIGYDAVWTTVRASDVGAPHRRERVFVLAYPRCAGREEPRLSITTPTKVTRTDSDFTSLSAYDVWGRVVGRHMPPVAELLNGEPQLSPKLSEWLMWLSEGWVTAVPGLTRNEQLRMLGNGVVPQQAAYALNQLLPLTTKETT